MRERLLRRFCDPDTVESLDFTIPFFGKVYTGNLNCYLDWCVFFLGAYEKQMLFLMRDIVGSKGAAVLLDVGANVGQHTLFMSSYCKQVHAFEPYGPVREKMAKKLVLNAVGNVVIHDVALGSRDEELEFFAPKGANTGTGSFVQSHATDNNVPVGTLRVVEGDAYLRSRGVEQIDLIKIDVEGFEKRVLVGLRNALDRCRPVVLMEVSSSTRADLTGVEDLMSLVPAGYSAKMVRTDETCCVLFNRPRYRLVDIGSNLEEGNILLCPVEWTTCGAI